ncbi:MAG: hypothetical protein R3B72_23695 [Polyangiaceae bacterium]
MTCAAAIHDGASRSEVWAAAPYAEAAPRLLPRLRNTRWIESRARTAGASAIQRLVAPGLHLTLVVDEPEHCLPLTPAMLEGWGVRFEEAAERALENLAAITPDHFWQLAPGLWLTPGEDGHAAARLLLFPCLAHQLVAALPDRDVLLIADPAQPGALSALALALEAVVPVTPLSDRLYAVDPVAETIALHPARRGKTRAHLTPVPDDRPAGGGSDDPPGRDEPPPWSDRTPPLTALRATAPGEARRAPT